MWEKTWKYHAILPPMTGNGKHTTHKNGGIDTFPGYVKSNERKLTLVGGEVYPSEKSDFVNWDDYLIPNCFWKKSKVIFQLPPSSTTETQLAVQRVENTFSEP